MKEEIKVLQHLNFFNKVINGLLAVDVKIDEEDKALILLSSLSESHDLIITTMLYGKGTLILEELASTLLSNKIRKKPKLSRKDPVWWSCEGKKEKERKVRVHQRGVTFVNRKITGRRIISINKSD